MAEEIPEPIRLSNAKLDNNVVVARFQILAVIAFELLNYIKGLDGGNDGVHIEQREGNYDELTVVKVGKAVLKHYKSDLLSQFLGRGYSPNSARRETAEQFNNMFNLLLLIGKNQSSYKLTALENTCFVVQKMVDGLWLPLTQAIHDEELMELFGTCNPTIATGHKRGSGSTLNTNGLYLFRLPGKEGREEVGRDEEEDEQGRGVGGDSERTPGSSVSGVLSPVTVSASISPSMMSTVAKLQAELAKVREERAKEQEERAKEREERAKEREERAKVQEELVALRALAMRLC